MNKRNPLRRNLVLLVGTLGLSAGFAFAALTPEQIKKLPPSAEKKVDFAKDVKPILAESCFSCHAEKKQKGKLRLDSREALLKGGKTGPAAVVGKSADSDMIARVCGLVEDPDDAMPPEGDDRKPLTKAQIGVLRAWIDQGLVWAK